LSVYEELTYSFWFFAAVFGFGIGVMLISGNEKYLPSVFFQNLYRFGILLMFDTIHQKSHLGLEFSL